jgi:hypothetical protein
VNAGNTTVDANIVLDFAASGEAGTVVLLAPDATGRIDVPNTLENPTAAIPHKSVLSGLKADAGKQTTSFKYSLVGHSVNVLTIPVL